MLSYQHRYHAGNFADIHKHLALMIALNHLNKKESPYCVLDLFAGEGVYDLSCDEALKLKEYQYGYEQLSLESPLAKTLQQLATDLGERFSLHMPYPGSPAIIQHFLRAQDSAHLVEKHPQAVSQLKRYFNKYSNIAIHDRDSYEALLALTPFKEKRGLIFIDPSYELKREYTDIAQLTQKLLQRARHLMVLIWYPVLQENYHQELISSIAKTGVEHICSEWRPKVLPTKKGMQASGLLFINPCWQFQEMLEQSVSL